MAWSCIVTKRSAVAGACLAAAFVCGAGEATAQVPLTSSVNQATGLTSDDMRILAQQLLDSGRPSDAGQVLNALLSRDPDDVTALIMGAQAALSQNQPAAAVDLAARGYATAQDRTSRYVAARLAALAHAALQQDTRAQLWLRRARQYAPDQANADSVAQDYASLRDRNPLSFQLEFGASPSNNINNGSRSDTVSIGPFVSVLSESAKPLSGIRFNASGTLRYRLDETETSQTSLEFDFSTTTYALSQTSRDALQRDIDGAAGDASDLPRAGSDFAYTESSVSLTHREIFRQGSKPTSAALQLGRSWYGGDPYQIFAAASASQTFALGASQQLRVDAFYRYNFDNQPVETDRFGVPIENDDVSNLGVGIGYARVMDGGNVASVDLTRRFSMSDNAENDFTSWRVGAGLDLGRPVMDVRFGFGAQIEARDFGQSIYTTGLRRDHIVTGQVTAVFDDLEYYGFTPAVTLSAGRTYSKAERFDTDFANVGVDLRSAF